ncbi:MAG: tetratricopeptide repeat protein [Deltaproteobacteria bacterium]|nr:tetratricopeptide repeat protein [Deltaproteobacteria bacterium]
MASVEEVLRTVEEAFDAGDVEAVRKALVSAGDDVGFQIARARLKAADGDPQAATAQLQMLAKKHGKDVGVQAYLGALMVGQHRYKDAKKHLEAAREGGADFPAFHHAYGVYNAAIGKFREAVLHLSQAGQVWTSSAPTFFYLGVSLMELGELGRAEQALRAVTEMQPRYVDAWDALAQVYQRQGKTEEASRVVDAGLQANPGEAALVRTRVGLLARAGRHKEAAATLNTIPESARSAEDLVNLAMLSLETGDAKSAVAQARAATERAPKFGRGHYVLGMALENSGDNAGAITALEKAVAVGDPDGSAGTRLGFLLTAEGRLDKAIKALETALKRSDNAPGTLLNLALAHAKADRKDKARQLATTILADERASASDRDQATRLQKALQA